jgi:hypothetical protein
MASPTVSWKRGSTFAASVAYAPGGGDPPTLDGIIVESAVMDHREVRYPLLVTIHEDKLGFDIRFIGDTSEWAVGTAALDFRCLEVGIVFYSTTARFTIEPQITL